MHQRILPAIAVFFIFAFCFSCGASSGDEGYVSAVSPASRLQDTSPVPLFNAPSFTIHGFDEYLKTLANVCQELKIDKSKTAAILKAGVSTQNRLAAEWKTQSLLDKTPAPQVYLDDIILTNSVSHPLLVPFTWRLSSWAHQESILDILTQPLDIFSGNPQFRAVKFEAIKSFLVDHAIPYDVEVPFRHIQPLLKTKLEDMPLVLDSILKEMGVPLRQDMKDFEFLEEFQHLVTCFSHDTLQKETAEFFQTLAQKNLEKRKMFEAQRDL